MHFLKTALSNDEDIYTETGIIYPVSHRKNSVIRYVYVSANNYSSFCTQEEYQFSVQGKIQI